MKKPLFKNPFKKLSKSDEEAARFAEELHVVLKEGDSTRVAEAVTLAEDNTSSEIMVKLSAATGDDDLRSIAEAEFIRLGLAAHAHGNGVLIYVSLNRRAVEIVVGPKAASELPQDLWRSAAAEVADGFREKRAVDGIIAAIATMAGPLAQVFPPLGTPETELPNVSEDS